MKIRNKSRIRKWYRDVNCYVYARLYVEYQNVFGRIQDEKMIEMLKNTGIRIIRNLYSNQTSTLRIDAQGLTKTINIKRGVRQGCIFSSLIFKLYSEEISKDALKNIGHGILLAEDALTTFDTQMILWYLLIVWMACNSC